MSYLLIIFHVERRLGEGGIQTFLSLFYNHFLVPSIFELIFVFTFFCNLTYVTSHDLNMLKHIMYPQASMWPQIFQFSI